AAEPVWDALVAGAERAGIDLTPCGLAARDSLRLEAGMPLYGNEITLETTPVDIGMGKMALNALKRERLYAREPLAAAAESQPARRLVGLVSDGRRAARAGSDVLVDDRVVGVVTSGQPSPTLGHPIALAYVDQEHTDTGTELVVDIRGKAHPFRIVDLPFHPRRRPRAASTPPRYPAHRDTQPPAAKEEHHGGTAPTAPGLLVLRGARVGERERRGRRGHHREGRHHR